MYSLVFFFLQAEDGIRYLVRSRGLGDVYKRQGSTIPAACTIRSAGAFCAAQGMAQLPVPAASGAGAWEWSRTCLLYTSDAADERSSVDLGGRRIIKKKKKETKAHLTRDEHKARGETHITQYESSYNAMR